MSKKPGKQDPLRTTAEAQLAHAPDTKTKPHPAGELLHELQVHQIELEMQNEQLRQAQLELEESRDRYVDLYEFAPVGYLTLTDNGVISEVNLTAATLLGVERKELLHHRFSPFVAQKHSDRWNRLFVDALQRDGRQSCELSLQRGDGSALCAQLDYLRLARDGEPPAVRIALTDLTGHQATEAKIQRLTQLYAALSQCNQAIVRCTNEGDLFPRACRDAVQFGGFKMAWIGLVGEAGQRVVPVASYGEGVEYLEGIQVSVDADSPLGRGPTGASIRENQPFWCQDFQNDPDTASWHESGARFGWGSSASLPLRKNGVVIGAFTLYSGAVNAFDEAARNLLVEMAADISFALDNFAHEAERKRQAERTAALLELTASAETLDEKTLLQRGLDTLQHLTDSRIGFLHFVSEDQNGIELVTWSNDTLAHYCRAVFDSHYPVSAAGIWADCIRLKQPVIINDYAAAPGKKWLPEGHAHLQRFISVPIFEDELVRMIVGVGNAARDYDEHDMETVKLFSYDLYHIVQRKRAIRSLEKNEQHFRAVTESANDAIITATGAGNITGWNTTAGRVFGYTKAEIIGQPLTVLMPERFRNLHRDGLARVVAGGAPHVIGKTVELAGLRKDGSEFPLEFSLAQWQATDGQFFTAIIRDITERKQAEAKLTEQVEELRCWHDATIGREMRVLDLKHEVNELLGQAEQPPRYPSAEPEDPQEK